LARKGARASFHGIPTYVEIIMDFSVIFGFGKLKKYFYIYFGCGNNTWHTSRNLQIQGARI